MARDLHPVGGVRFDDAETVFREPSARLGPLAPRRPDGERGRRHRSIVRQRAVFEASPDCEATGRRVRPGSWVTPVTLREGTGRDAIAFGPLGHAAAARESQAAFARLRAEGVIPEGVRFMVALPMPTAVEAA